MAQKEKKRSEDLENLDLESKNLSMELVRLGVLTPRILGLLREEFMSDSNRPSQKVHCQKRSESVDKRWKKPKK